MAFGRGRRIGIVRRTNVGGGEGMGRRATRWAPQWATGRGQSHSKGQGRDKQAHEGPMRVAKFAFHFLFSKQPFQDCPKAAGAR